MRRLRYGINLTLDGCVHHEAGLMPDAESMALWTAELASGGALLYGRATFEMMRSAWRRPESGAWPDWMGPDDIAFAEVMDPMAKLVVSSTLENADWNAELVRGDLATEVRRLKEQSGEDLLTGGVTLPRALLDLGLIDELLFLIHPVVAGHGPYLFAGTRERLELKLLERNELSSGVVAVRYRPA